jgi:hypothetical protein
MNVKVDVWLTRTGMHLGHNEPQYPINNSWIHMRSHFLWVHCKNIEALCYFQEYPWEEDVNYFWHENDSYTLTSRGYIWAYPGKNTVYPSHAITLLPEVSDISFTNFYGICTDYPLEYK